MGDVVRAVAGWVERVRGAGQAETQFASAGVQGLMGGELRKRKPREPKLRVCAPGRWACGGMLFGHACIGLGDDGPASAWESWRRCAPWWRRWLVPHARAPKRRGHVPPSSRPYGSGGYQPVGRTPGAAVKPPPRKP